MTTLKQLKDSALFQKWNFIFEPETCRTHLVARFYWVVRKDGKIQMFQAVMTASEGIREAELRDLEIEGFKRAWTNFKKASVERGFRLNNITPVTTIPPEYKDSIVWYKTRSQGLNA